MVANKELSDKDYVSLEAAKALKGIGYNVPTHTHYHIRDDKVYVGLSSNPEHWGCEYEKCDRPPYSTKGKGISPGCAMCQLAHKQIPTDRSMVL